MMDYTPEQRAIIIRMGEASRKIRDARARHRNAHVSIAGGINDSVSALARAASALVIALEQSDELHVLLDEHSDAFHEFLDSL